MAYSTNTQVYLLSGLTSTDISTSDVDALIAFADAEINAKSGKNFGTANTQNEWISLRPPVRVDDIKPNVITLKFRPVQSITYFAMMNTSGSASTPLATLTGAQIASGTWQTTDYFIDPLRGTIELNSNNFDMVPSRVNIQYTYGYTTVPTIVSELSAVLTAMKAWIKFLGGNYGYIQSYSLPEQSYNKGDLFARGKSIVEGLQQRADTLWDQVGEKHRSMISFGAGYF